jgi:hypothetical protein
LDDAWGVAVMQLLHKLHRRMQGVMLLSVAQDELAAKQALLLCLSMPASAAAVLLLLPRL